jgi:tRNA dimethylallyltransferase
MRTQINRRLNSAKFLITIEGPTAIGKTALAIKLAQHYTTEIVSADSRQFFKEMNIGTAVPSTKELQATKHYFIQHKSIHETYSVGDYEKEAIALLEKLFKKHSVVILVGGSGLYVDAITEGLDHFPEVDTSIRAQLNKKLASNGIHALQQQLKQLDPIYFQRVDIHNPHRLIRALEICMGTGKPYSSFLNKEKNSRPFTTIKLALNADREIIYNRINKRVDTMVAQGLIEEAKQLHKYKHLNALQTVGYKELFEYFEGNTSLEKALEEIKKNTRRFAKRQLTWLRKDTNIFWMDWQYNLPEVVNYINTIINKKPA